MARKLYGHNILGVEFRGETIAVAIAAMSAWFTEKANTPLTYVVNITTFYEEDDKNRPWAVTAWVDNDGSIKD